ncbi:hypothetical protein SteCoe_29818 [Stentor coeruleus]|uniref:Uncharacterized protein n=1 Tax=Stentor coeruleus TaxID=5963 RepID=A0A1R2B512_9CILI|nr:hypothetical protein SteCoe_29818 [Stentor coeruleus]
MLPMRKNKDPIAALQSKKPQKPLFNSKTSMKTLKHYNSCFHQKILNRKDTFVGPTTYISSVKKHELTKTLQAYYSIGEMSQFRENTSQLKNINPPIENNESSSNKNKKIKCEGFCGKILHFSMLNSVVMENERKHLCPNCIEQIMFGVP